MSRSRSKVSRSLAAVLAASVVIGGIAYFTAPKTKIPASSDPNLQAALSPAPVDVAIALPTTKPAGPIISSTPTTVPAVVEVSIKPPTLMNVSAPTTAPVVPGNRTSVSDSPTVSGTISPSWATDAQAKIDANDFITARRIANTALTSGTLTPAEATRAKEIVSKLNDTLVFTARRSPADDFGATYVVQPGEMLKKIADRNDISADLIMRINGITDARKLRAGQSIKIFKGPFSAVVSKRDFTLEVWLGEPNKPGSMFVKTFRVGLGRDNSTPDGVWQVRPGGKLKNPKFWGAGDLPPMEADDPKNPLGERWIALDGIDGNAVGKQSYGIHGTIDPDSVGKMASMGCIRLKNEDVELVYDLLVDGKSIIVVKD